MKVNADLESSRIELTFTDQAELRAFLEGAKEQGAFLVELPEEPAPLAEYTILVRLEPAFEAQLSATVVQLFEAPKGVSAAFELEPLSRGWELDFERRLRQASRPAQDHSEMTGSPPIVRIRKMNVRERMHLATKADRAERATLLRDGSPQVLMGLLTNPRVGADDVVQIIGNPQASPGVLDRVSRERRWLTNPEVRKALVRNPKTPSPIAIRLVDSLPTEELRRLAKIQTGLREDLRKAALRVYLKRTRR